MKQAATPSPSDVAQLQKIQEYRKQAETILQDAAQKTIVAAAQDLQTAQAYGYNSAAAELGKRLPGPTKHVVAAQVNAMAGNLQNMNFAIVRSTQDTLHAVTSQAALAPLLSAETREQAAQRALNEFASRGITTVVGAGGRKIRIEHYVEMSLRTQLMNAALEGHAQALKQDGRDLVIVSDHKQECKHCRPFEGKVLALTGDAGFRSVPNEVNPGNVTVAVVATVAQARSEGLFHPNCRHTFTAYIPGATKTKTFGETADPEGDKLRQKQRELERRVREAKRREVVAMDGPEKAAAKKAVNAHMKNLREFAKAHELKRLPERERITGSFGSGDAKGLRIPNPPKPVVPKPPAPPAPTKPPATTKATLGVDGDLPKGYSQLAKWKSGKDLSQLSKDQIEAISNHLTPTGQAKFNKWLDAANKKTGNKVQPKPVPDGVPPAPPASAKPVKLTSDFFAKKKPATPEPAVKKGLSLDEIAAKLKKGDYAAKPPKPSVLKANKPTNTWTLDDLDTITDADMDTMTLGMKSKLKKNMSDDVKQAFEAKWQAAKPQPVTATKAPATSRQSTKSGGVPKIAGDDTKPPGSKDNPTRFGTKDTSWKKRGAELTNPNKSAWDKAGHHSVVRRYTGSWYSKVNAQLRKDAVDDATSKAVQNLDEAFYDSAVTPQKDWGLVSRGGSPVELGNGLSKGASLADVQAQVGKTVVHKGYTSTSITERPAFGGRMRMLIKTPPGTRGIYVDSTPGGRAISANVGEREYVLPRECEFRIIGVERSQARGYEMDVVVELVKQHV